MNVSGNEEIQLAVSVVISKSGASGPIAKRHARLFRHVGKSSVVIVMIQPILPVVGHVDIRPTVVVVVTDRDAKTPTVIRHTGLLGDIRKRPVVIVMKERGLRRGHLAIERLEG